MGQSKRGAAGAADKKEIRREKGGLMTGMRSSFRNVATGGSDKKGSRVGNVVSWLLLLAAIAFLAYRWTQ